MVGRSLPLTLLCVWVKYPERWSGHCGEEGFDGTYYPRALYTDPATQCAAKLGQGRIRHKRFASHFVVESRSGAVAYELRFQIPLIKPDVRISRISAFGQGSYLAFAHGRLF